MAGARLGKRAAEHVLDGDGAVVVGLLGEGVCARALAEVIADRDPVHRRPREPAHAAVLDLARHLGL